MKKNKFRLLRDEDILKLSNNRFVINELDFNLKKGSDSNSELIPQPGGLYDGRIFGSMFESRCNCGAVKTTGIPCDICKTTAYTSEDRMLRYGAIDVGFHYVNQVRFDAFFSFLKKELKIKSDEKNPRRLVYLSSWKYDEETRSAVAIPVSEAESLDDCSLEGLIKIIRDNKPEKLSEMFQYMNRYVPVLPAILRKVKFFRVNGKKKLELPKSTVYYRSLIIAIKRVTEAYENSDDIELKILLSGNLRLYAANMMERLTGVTNTSRQNFFRNQYRTNSAHSGRAVIVGDPSLRIDQIGLPRALAYELYKKQFLKHLIEDQGFEQSNAVKLYNSPDPEVLKTFDEFLSTKLVLINRPPTLHRYNLMSFIPIAVDDSAIHMPLLVTKPFNADFDGDAVTFFQVPDEMKHYVFERTSPAYIKYYDRDLSAIFKPTHEILHGLILMTKFSPTQNIQTFNSFDAVQDAFDADDLWYSDTIQIGDEVTTYGREKLARILRVTSLNQVIGESAINLKNLEAIYGLLGKYRNEDRVEILKEMSEEALEVATLSGSTSVSLDDIYYEIPEEFKDAIARVQNSSDSKKKKILQLENIKDEIIESYASSRNEEVRSILSESDRAKLHSLVSLTTPMFFLNSEGDLLITENSTIQGLDETGVALSAYANREQLKLKAFSVPLSGFLTRQAQESLRDYLVKRGKDETNKGLLIKAKNAEGRYSLDGKIYPSSTSSDLVLVKSCLTTELPHLTPDLFNSKYDWVFDSHGVNYFGASTASGLTESITQSGLSLKHVSSGRFVDSKECVILSEDAEFKVEGDYYYVGNDKYPKPKSLVSLDSGFYKKGTVVAWLPFYRTPSYNLDCIMKFLKGQGSMRDSELKNSVAEAVCFNLSEELTIKESSSPGVFYLGSQKIELGDGLLLKPIGSKVKPYERYRSGVMKMDAINKAPLNDRYLVFSEQLRELLKLEEGVIELLFKSINHSTYSGIFRSNVKHAKSALSAVAFGYAKKNLTRVIKGELEIVDDNYTNLLMTPTLLKLIDKLNE